MKSHPQFQIEIGNAKRWADCLTWRAVFVFLIGPGVQVLTWWILAGLDRAAVPNNLVMAYGLVCLTSLVFGLLCWSESPARLRRHAMHWIWPR